MKKSGFEIIEREGGEVLMRGRLTVENASAIRSGLLTVLQRRDSVRVSVGTAEVDISFLQILCAAHRMAGEREKSVAKGDYSDGFVSSIMDAGYARNRGCSPGGGTDCLWIVGGEND